MATRSTWLLGGAGLVLVGMVAAGGWISSSAWPDTGVRPAPGLAAPVEILRDEWAVPHVFAGGEEDAAEALGWLHAADRLWQMETTRRLGAGRLAEILGPAALPSDRWMRTLGVYRLAQDDYPRLSERTRRLLEAYARGVNAWLAGRDRALPPEFLVLRTTPEPWTPADSLVWLKLMAMRLSSDRRDELLRARLLPRLGPDRLADLWPDAPATPVTLPASRERDAALEPGADDLASQVAMLAARIAEPPIEPHGASNVWAIAGDRSASGKPLLANDPHLSFSLPQPWYLVRISTPDGELAGATAPGFPALALGHDGRVAWGLTTSEIDTEDVFVERVEPGHPDRYLTPDGSLPFDTRRETIFVKGAAPETLVLRSTRHGPVISDLPGAAAVPGSVADETVLALAATWLSGDDTTADALLALGRARDAAALRSAAAQAVAPQQNVVYADVEGHIGWIAAGRIPLRAPGGGWLPAPGWTGEADWRGFVPVSGWPQALDPPEGLLVNANNRPVPADWPWPIRGSWDAGFRATRIAERLEPAVPQSVAASAALQVDDLSLMARRLLPAMLGGLPPPAEPMAARAVEMLRGWSGEMRAERPEPLIFAAWLREFVRRVAADELGELFGSWWDYRPLFVERVLHGRDAWCDDIRTAETETCPEQLGGALTDALALLSRRLGDDPNRWRWGELHVARFTHPFWSRIPILGGLVDVRFPTDGGNDTVDRAASSIADPEEPFAAVHGAGFRAVYDLADLGRSRFVLAAGQSGNPLSRHFADMTALWRVGGSVRLDGSRESLLRTGADRLVLQPPAEPADGAGGGSGTGMPSSAR